MGLLDIIAVILIVGWIAGLGFKVAGGLIHILLVVAVILFLMRFFRGGA